MAFLEGLMLSGQNLELVQTRYSIFYPIGGYFENISAICEIGESKIVLNLKKGKIIVCGENLQIYAYSDKDAFVKGKILSVVRC